MTQEFRNLHHCNATRIKHIIYWQPWDDAYYATPSLSIDYPDKLVKMLNTILQLYNTFMYKHYYVSSTEYKCKLITCTKKCDNSFW